MKTLVRLPNWIGDAVMAAPAIRLLADPKHSDSLSAYGPPKTAGLFHHFSGVDRVFEWDEEEEERIAEEIRNQGYERVVLFTNSYSSTRIAKDLGIPIRIGYRRDFRGPLLTHPVPCSPKTRYLHMVDYYLGLLPPEWRVDPVDRQPRLFVSEEEESNAKERLRTRFGDLSSEPILAVAPGASYGSAKRWFHDRFKAVVSELANQGNRILVVGSASEEKEGEDLIEGIPPEHGWNLAGKTSLRELMAALGVCDCLLTNDSGPMHLADALGTPAVAIFGSTDSTWTGPQASHHRVLQAEAACTPCFLRECPLGLECMQSITVEEVLGAASKVLVSHEKGILEQK